MALGRVMHNAIPMIFFFFLYSGYVRFRRPRATKSDSNFLIIDYEAQQDRILRLLEEVSSGSEIEIDSEDDCSETDNFNHCEVQYELSNTEEDVKITISQNTIAKLSYIFMPQTCQYLL
uniref:Uncharacterized protein LOC114331942 n=1 Tax=Diabrotica virgifera virgifera TaxID=50390 RepID=A0A6P7FXZ1_DIAVI